MKSKSEENGTTPVILRPLPGTPPRIFAVGDIHGHADELSRLLDFLVDSKGCCADDQVVFIGDYIDRGSNSKGVIERLLEVQREWPNTVFLKGNHEEMLLSFLGFGGENGEYYLKNGGGTFFKSYGLEPFGSLEAMREKLPDSHLSFLKSAELGVTLGDCIFVHAGLSPSRPLDNQLESDLLWIREEFLAQPHPFGKTVVFGHTAFNKVFLDLPYRIGIDTGVAFGNVLTAVELMHGQQFQVDVGGTVVREGSLGHRV